RGHGARAARRDRLDPRDRRIQILTVTESRRRQSVIVAGAPGVTPSTTAEGAGRRSAISRDRACRALHLPCAFPGRIGSLGAGGVELSPPRWRTRRTPRARGPIREGGDR